MGPISAFLTRDHKRLDDFLNKAEAQPDRIDLEPFGVFREGILRHIGMEERILIPALLRRSGAPVKLTEKMRLDHSAISNLLMPAPTHDIIKAIRAILEPHNRLEEESGGFYDACDSMLADQAEELVKAMRAAPEVPLKPYSQRPEALAAAKRAMSRAGFDWQQCVSRR